MPPTFLQAAEIDQPAGTLSSYSVAFGSNNTAGSCLVGFQRPGSTITGITDTQGNSWSTIAGNGNSWIAPNCKAGANTVTVALSAAANLQISFAEYGGVATTSPVDQADFAATGLSTAALSSSVTTTRGGELIIGAFSQNGTNTPAYTAGSPATLRTGGVNAAIQDFVQSTAGAVTTSATVPSSTWDMFIVTLFPMSAVSSSFLSVLQGPLAQLNKL